MLFYKPVDSDGPAGIEGPVLSQIFGEPLTSTGAAATEVANDS